MHHQNLTRRALFLSALAAVVTPTPSHSAATAYVLGPKGAQITYSFVLGGTAQTGTVPVARADLLVDPNNLTASRADVTADLRRAKTGLIFATQALKSPDVLDAEAHPFARFTSTSVTLGAGGRISDGARITGRLTLRGQTRTIRFDASLHRPKGSAANDFSTLHVTLRGHLSRKDFGATGFPDLVEDRIGMDIRAQIRATQ